MRIAMISTPHLPVPPPKYGGTELIVATLTEELLRRGHEVVLYATGDSAVPGADLRWIYPRAEWPPQPAHELNHAAYAVRDVLQRDDIDLVHAHIAPAMAMAPFIDLPVVYTLHHAYEAPLSTLYRGSLSSRSRLVAISARQRELLGPGLSADVIYHGLRTERYALGAGGGPAVFLGRFAQEKGVHLALEAASRAGVPITLAGRPHWNDEEYFRVQVEPLLARPGVRWEGEAAHEAKVALLGGAPATMFPIQWEEPFGLVMIESMLCGAPVLAFACGSAPEIVDDGVTGWIVDDVDEMAWRLRELAGGAARFDRARCRQRAEERFSSSTMAEAYLSLYSRVLGSPALSAVPIH
jgi:glycosyltransferase involved in cell wall biosynthesis